MAVKKIESFNIHETPATNQNEFDVETYLNANWEKTKEVVNNNADELTKVQEDISTLKEDYEAQDKSIEDISNTIISINKNLEDIDTKDKEQEEKIKANKLSIETLQAEKLEIKTENERLREDIKSIAVPGEVSGENIHIEDSSDARCEIEIGGNHVQETREGYSLLKNNFEIFSTSVGGINLEFKDDGSFSFKGTTTGTWGKKRNTGNIYNITAGTYTVYLKAVGNCPNARLTISLEDINMKTLVNGTVLVNNSSLIKVGTFNYDGTTEIAYTTIALESITANSAYDCVFYPMLLKGTYTVEIPYEQYGASPSIDYPSEIKTVGNNINELANLIQTQNKNGVEITRNNDGSLTFNGTATDSISNIDFNNEQGKYFNAISGVSYTISLKNNNGLYFRLRKVSENVNIATLDSPVTSKTFVSNYTGECLAYLSIIKGTTFDNLTIYPKIEKGIIATPYSTYNYGSVKVDIANSNNTETQQYTIDVQQEMLEGDYLDLENEKEHHEWKKLVLTGEESITYYDAPSTEIANNLDTAYFTVGITGRAQGKSNNIISNMFRNLYTTGGIWGTASSTSETLKESIAVDASIRLRINKNRLEGYDNSLTSNEKIVLLKTYIKSKYDAGNPIIVYYKLAEPLDLEFTEAQKVVAKQIKEAHTYKNITNISAESAELGPIIKVKYLKDPETEHNKLQAQIDEIKELLSPTETSAMLLNNMQTDLESEV